MNVELETIILITKMQYLYICACHDINWPNKLEHGLKNAYEALDDYNIIIHKIDPDSEMYLMLIDLKHKMDTTLSTIENTLANEEDILYYEPTWNFYTLIHEYFPCLYSCTKNIKEVYYTELVKKLRNKNHELVEDNERLRMENENYKNYTDNIVTGEKYIPLKKYKYKSC